MAYEMCRLNQEALRGCVGFCAVRFMHLGFSLYVQVAESEKEALARELNSARESLGDIKTTAEPHLPVENTDQPLIVLKQKVGYTT